MLLAAFAIAAAIVAGANPGPTPKLSAEESVAYERGRAYERVVLSNMYRGWYGIALFHSRFAADIDAMESGTDFAATPEAKQKLYEPMRTFLESGDASKLPKELADWNYFDPFVGEKTLPAEAWFVQAGIAEVEARAAGTNLVLQLMAGPRAKWLVDHASAGGDIGSKLKAFGKAESADSMLSVEGAIKNQFATLASPSTFVTLAYPSGLIGDARLGMAVATINQMLDSPALLAQAESQGFVLATVAQLRSLATTDDVRSRVADLRRALVVDGSFQHEAAAAAMNNVIGSVIRPLPENRRDCILFGVFAAQIPYNAAVFRDPAAAGQQLGSIAQFHALDAADPAAAQIRAQLVAVTPNDWASVVRLGRALVHEIETHK